MIPRNVHFQLSVRKPESSFLLHTDPERRRKTLKSSTKGRKTKLLISVRKMQNAH